MFGLSRTYVAIDQRVKMYQGDLLDQSKIKRIIRMLRPDVIYHLAAQSDIPDSFSNPQETVSININGTLNLLESIRTVCSNTRLLSVGSSAEYGWTAQTNHLLMEEAPLRPSSPYAVAKVAQGNLVHIYRKGYGLHMTHVRPFAIIGPRKTKDAVSDFARGIIAIERGMTKVLRVGDVSQVRDFVDVRDAARALSSIADKGSSLAVVNICSGKGVSLENVLKQLIKFAKVRINIHKDMARSRVVEDVALVGDPRQLRSLKFIPRFFLEQSLSDILAYWRQNAELYHD